MVGFKIELIFLLYIFFEGGYLKFTCCGTLSRNYHSLVIKLSKGFL